MSDLKRDTGFCTFNFISNGKGRVHRAAVQVMIETYTHEHFNILELIVIGGTLLYLLELITVLNWVITEQRPLLVLLTVLLGVTLRGLGVLIRWSVVGIIPTPSVEVFLLDWLRETTIRVTIWANSTSSDMNGPGGGIGRFSSGIHYKCVGIIGFPTMSEGEGAPYSDFP